MSNYSNKNISPKITEQKQTLNSIQTINPGNYDHVHLPKSKQNYRNNHDKQFKSITNKILLKYYNWDTKLRKNN